MSQAVDQCKDWVDKVVVKHHFCPFAQREVENDTVHYSLFSGEGIEESLHCLIEECSLLDSDKTIETTLIVFENIFGSFDEFLDVVELAEQLMDESGYRGIYQLANFHPDYCFDDVEEDDASNYTNRSPLPMLHLIREKSMEVALESYPEPDLIPEKNINLAREKGSGYFKEIMESIKNSNEIDK